MMYVKCPFCKGKMKEVSRDEEANEISIVFKCKDCGREPMATYEFENFSDEDDNYVDGAP